MGKQVFITDVGPRDGLQNQKTILTAAQKLSLVNALVAAGLPRVEVGAFVSPRAVPAMAGTDEVVAQLKQGASTEISALVPNLRGYEMARDAGVKTVAMVVYASDGMAQKNVNMTRQQAMESTREIISRAKVEGVKVLTTIAVSFHCPFDGPVDAQTVLSVAQVCAEAGSEEVIIADTIGAASPQDVEQLMMLLVSNLGADKLACHFHDTRAMGLANIYAALTAGIRKFDASVGGLGGCPFAPGASGNVATEDAVMMLEQMGYNTNVDQVKLLAASDLAEALTGRAAGGRAKAWLKQTVASEVG